MKIIIFFLLAIISFVIFGFEVYRRYKHIKRGRAENRSDRPTERWKYFITNVLLHKKIRKYPLFGLAHAFIMWGFLILLFSSIDLALTGLFHTSLPWLGDNAGYMFIRDSFLLLVVVGIIGCAMRRLIKRPEWLNNNLTTFIILALIPVIVLSELFYYAVQTAQGGSGLKGAWLVIAVSPLFIKLSYPLAYLLADFFWWIHFLAIFAFLPIIPYSKHMHLLFAALNTYWHTLEPKGALKPVQFDGNEKKVYGVGKLEDFTWKQLFDAFSCVKCGRCNESCPAYLSGEQLKPKRMNGRLRKYMEKKDSLLNKFKIRRSASADNSAQAGTLSIVKPTAKSNGIKNNRIKDNTEQDDSVKDTGTKGNGKKHKDKKNDQNRIVANLIEEEFLWSCTTCGACLEACPVSCEHTSKIIDIRRYIVSGTENIPLEIQQVFQGIGDHGNPWGIKRKWDTEYNWAKEQGIPTLAENPAAEYLYFVGCAPFSDQRAQKTAVSFAKILQIAQVDFAILGEEEWCCGETTRRLGNEFLFQTTVRRNIAAWQNLGIKKILTTCPHCFNTLQNEYSQFGGAYEVIPHSVFLAGLLQKGKLKPAKAQNITATYHDPCYLGRYNGYYEEQRQILKELPGVSLVEMPRTRENSFCCGAGGGRFWLKDKEVNVISKNRAQEALATGANVICTACSFCRAELQDEIRRRDLEADIKTIDIAVILEASL